MFHHGMHSTLSPNSVTLTSPLSSLVIGSGDLRKLTLRVRDQPVNFMIIVHQSLETAKSGQRICKAGTKASRVLLGEENHPERDRARYISKTIEEIKTSAAALNQHTNGIHTKFRLLRTSVLDVRSLLSILDAPLTRSI